MTDDLYDHGLQYILTRLKMTPAAIDLVGRVRSLTGTHPAVRSVDADPPFFRAYRLTLTEDLSAEALRELFANVDLPEPRCTSHSRHGYHFTFGQDGMAPAFMIETHQPHGYTKPQPPRPLPRHSL